jgi:hypothetical protein
MRPWDTSEHKQKLEAVIFKIGEDQEAKRRELEKAENDRKIAIVKRLDHLKRKQAILQNDLKEAEALLDALEDPFIVTLGVSFLEYGKKLEAIKQKLEIAKERFKSFEGSFISPNQLHLAKLLLAILVTILFGRLGSENLTLIEHVAFLDISGLLGFEGSVYLNILVMELLIGTTFYYLVKTLLNTDDALISKKWLNRSNWVVALSLFTMIITSLVL